MTNCKTKKRALFTSVLVLLLCCAMLVGTTFAWFTDSVTSGRNNIQSGNLDIVLEVGTPKDSVTGDALADPSNYDWAEVDANTKLFKDEDLYEPGFVRTVALRIRNNGSLALKYNFATINAGETKGVNKAGAEFLLSSYLKVVTAPSLAYASYSRSVLMGIAEDTVSAAGIGGAVGNIGDILSADTALLPGEAKWMTVAIVMPTTVGNEANHNGKNIPSIQLGVELVATQYTHEADSFGKDYDEDAAYPTYVNTDEDGQVMGEEAAAILESLTAGNDLIVDKGMDLLGFDTNEVDAQGATVSLNGVGPGAYGYLAFLPDAGEDVTVKNMNVTGSGFVEIGHYAIGGGTYTADNLKITNLKSTLANGDSGFTVGCAFMAFGDLTLNNCVMTGTTAKDGVMAVDLGCGQAWSGYTDGNDNKISTTVNGGKYGTIYCWSHSVVTINGAEVDTMYVHPINGTVTIKAGTHVTTINVDYGTSTANATRLAKLVIEEGATVDAIVYAGTTYTVAEWNAYVASL